MISQFGQESNSFIKIILIYFFLYLNHVSTHGYARICDVMILHLTSTYKGEMWEELDFDGNNKTVLLGFGNC